MTEFPHSLFDPTRSPDEIRHRLTEAEEEHREASERTAALRIEMTALRLQLARLHILKTA